MALGEVVQVAAAFVMVQGALNWFVDNYHRLADWVSSVNRVSALLLALDQIDGHVTSLKPASSSTPTRDREFAAATCNLRDSYRASGAWKSRRPIASEKCAIRSPLR